MKKFISLAMSAVMFFSSVAVGTVAQAGTVEDNLRAQGFSESYIEDLAALQKAHPNWKFVAFKTGIDFDDAVKGELAGTPTTETNKPAVSRLALRLAGLPPPMRWVPGKA